MKKIRILKMPLWLFITLATLLTIFIVFGIIILNAIIQFRKPVKTNPVIMDVKVDSVEIITDKEQITLELDEEYKIEYVVYPVDAVNKNVSFESNNETVASVDATGTVKAISGGVATITIITQDGNYTDSIVIIVNKDYTPTDIDPIEVINEVVSSINLSKLIVNDLIDINLDEELTINYEENPDVYMSWEVSDSNILSIENIDGAVNFIPLSTGNVTIYLTLTYLDKVVTKEYNVSINDEAISTNPSILSVDIIGNLEFFEKESVNTNDIKLMIKYSNETIKVISLYEYDSNIEFDTNVADCECVEGNIANKTLIVHYTDEYDNSLDVNIDYVVKKICTESLTITGVNEYYATGEELVITNIHAIMNNGEERDINLSDTTNNISTLDMNVAGEKTLIIEYLCKKIEIKFTVLDVIYRIIGLKSYYDINEVIDYTNVYLEKVINNVSTKIYLNTIYNDSELLALIDTSSAKVISFEIEYEGNNYYFGTITVKELKKIIDCKVNNLKDSIYINSIIDVNNLAFRFIYDDNSYIDKTYQEIKDNISGSFDTSTIGKKTLTINYEENVIEISYDVTYYKLDGYSIHNLNKFYLLNEGINYNEAYITLICNDATFTQDFYSDSFVISDIKTNEYGNFVSTITIHTDYLENDVIIEYNYSVINPISVNTDSYSSFGSNFKFYVNVDKKYYRDNYNLVVSGNSSYHVNSVTKNDSGNFEVDVTLEAGKSKATVYCTLEGSGSVVSVAIKRIYVTDTNITYNISGGSGYRLVGTSVVLELSATYNGAPLGSKEYDALSFTWSGSGITVDPVNPRRVTVSSNNSGSIEVTVTVSDGSRTKDIKTKVNYCNQPITNLGFVLGTKTFGIGKEYVLASKYLANPLTQTNPKTMTYNFEVFGSSEINKDDLVFYVSEEDKNIANFINNTLNVYEDGYVTLYVTTRDAINLGYTDSKYIGIYIGSWRVRCIGNSLYVSNFNQLKFALYNNYKVVLDSNIMYGPEVMDIVTDKTTGVVSRTLKPNYSNITAISALNSHLNKIDSTWNTKYIKNIALLNGRTPNIKLNVVCDITNDIYGNGYTIDLSQYTTLSQALTDTNPPFFSGPLKFLEALSIVRVYGQDDIGFLVHDNVTIDNVTLQNCDTGYLRVNNKLDYSRLNKVGTVVEVVGDNVSITNSRLLNGRNIIRSFGGDNNELIHVNISKCIISNAREYLIKIGANESIHTDTVMMYDGVETKVTDFYTKYGMKMDRVSKNIYKGIPGNDSLLFESSSPYLTDEDGMNYEPRDYSNINSSYFVSNYLKVDLTLANSVLERSGFFAICLESCFSGPVLGGYQYAPKDIDLGLGGFDYNGIYDINETSYAAILRLVGDVRIYNWKDIDEFDSSTIMEQISNAQALLKLVGEDTKFEFNIKEILSNVAPTDPTIIASIDGKTYAHGGIIFYGGGKNYHILDTSNYTGYGLSTHNISMNQMGDSTFVKCIPWVAGREPFRFVMYDSNSTLSYELQEELYRTNQAYSNIN